MSLRSEVIRIFNELVGAGKKITQLPSVTTPLAGTELLEIVQGGVNKKVTASSLSSGGTGVQTIVAGTNVTVDDTDPQNPIVNATGGGAVTNGSGTTANGTAVDLGGEITGNTLIADNGSGWNFELAQNATRFANIRGYASGAVNLDGATSTLLQTGSSTFGTSATEVSMTSSAGSIELSSVTGLVLTDLQVSKTGLKYAASGYATDSLSLIPKEDIVGVQDLFIPSAAMWPRVTAGCSALTQTEIATSLFNIQSLDFDQTTQEFAQFQIALPRKWNNGTVTAVVYWTAASGSGDVQWGISGGAYRNDDALSVALGTAQTTDDTLITANDLHITSATAAITLAGTVQDADFLAFQVSRNPASDTLTADAKLLGVSFRITTDAAKDA